MKKILGTVVLGMALGLAGCGSTVDLNDAPVENRSATSASDVNARAQVGAVNRQVPTVNPDANALMTNPQVRVIYFDFDSSTIRPEFASILEEHARYLNRDKSRKLAIEGHTDERGGREYNLALGQRRAEAVARALNLLGVSESQMEAVSFGKEKPAATGDDEQAMAKNRRAELSYR